MQLSRTGWAKLSCADCAAPPSERAGSERKSVIAKHRAQTSMFYRNEARPHRKGSIHEMAAAAVKRVKTEELEDHSDPRTSHATTETIFGKIVLHPMFDKVIMGVVACNSLLIGLQINHEATSDKKNSLRETIELICS